MSAVPGERSATGRTAAEGRRIDGDRRGGAGGPRHRYLHIQMEIADVPPVVDSGRRMGRICRKEPISQPNNPTLRAPFTGLNEEAGQSPALSRNGRPRLHPQPRRVRTTARRDVWPSRKGAGIAGNIAMRSAPLGQGVFCWLRPDVFGKGREQSGSNLSRKGARIIRQGRRGEYEQR